MSETNIQKFKRLLSELFMFENADLDFGIYRIMNAKREEIGNFLDKDLLPQVRKEIEHLGSGKRDELQEQLQEAIDTAKRFGANPDESEPVFKLREQLEKTVDVTALENDIFSDLYDFFSRYYSEGDYMSLRRYKEGVYAIPYEGEEVKLHWANADQYYIKTSEYFRDYTFRLPDRRRVHFKLTSADTEQNNNKTSGNDKRVFILCEEDFIAEEDGDLIIRFEYRLDSKKRKQSNLNDEAVERILAVSDFQSWMMILGRPAPTEKNADRRLLHKYLADYTSRNTFDYFIHKDLGGFLRRELDFFIKNEIMHLDDIESVSAPRVESYLSKIKAMRRVAHKVIDFLEQLENFQKKLWLKKKFVIETNYCITLDHVPEELYPEIAANDAQREEWVKLFAIDADDIENDIEYTIPLNIEFLKKHSELIVDTRYFDHNFKYELLSSFSNLDFAIEGTLVNSDNFHALNLLSTRYKKNVDCIYIDPPYNTGRDDFLYRDNYQHSSWLAMMQSCLSLARVITTDTGTLWTSLNDVEIANYRKLLDQVYGDNNFIASVIWQKKFSPQNDDNQLTDTHDYIIVYSNDANQWKAIRLPRTDANDSRFFNPDDDPRGPWSSGDLTSKTKAKGHSYPITTPSNEVHYPPEGRQWAPSLDTYKKLLANNRIWFGENGDNVPRLKQFQFEARGIVPMTLWTRDEVGDTQEAKRELNAYGYGHLMETVKPTRLVTRILQIGATSDALVMDFFAGSGTTGEAVIKLNSANHDKRKYILVEMGDYFEEILLNRIKKSVFANLNQNNKSNNHNDINHIFKYIRLESYDDTLNNLHWNRTPEQQSLLAQFDDFREDYMLHYVLDVESKDSQSLLDIKQFVNPFNYQMQISTGTVGETQATKIDLVETFNYLLGIHVRRIQAFEHIRVIEGRNREHQNVLIIWRNQEEIDNEALDKFFIEMDGLNANFDLIYVNGDNHLENLKIGKEAWQVRLIEPTFHDLMFDVQDV